MNYYNCLPVVLAGGFGKRLYPISTDIKPKQFLKLFNQKSCFQQALLRARNVFKRDKIYIIINKSHINIAINQIKEIGFDNYNIVIENEAKNTFISSLIACKIAEINNKDKILLFPCDHIINDNKNFKKDILKSLKQNSLNSHISFGIKPKFAFDKYGYIFTSKSNHQNKNNILKVEHFIEKPKKEIAIGYVKNKNVFWNSGVYLLNRELFIQEVQTYQQCFIKFYEDMKFISNNNILKIENEIKEYKSLSIDKAIIEKSKNINCLPVSFDWIDIGSFEMLFYCINKGINNILIKRNLNK